MPIHKLSKRNCVRNKFNDIVIIWLLLLHLYIIINKKEKRKIVIPKKRREEKKRKMLGSQFLPQLTTIHYSEENDTVNFFIW